MLSMIIYNKNNHLTVEITHSIARDNKEFVMMKQLSKALLLSGTIILMGMAWQMCAVRLPQSPVQNLKPILSSAVSSPAGALLSRSRTTVSYIQISAPSGGRSPMDKPEWLRRAQRQAVSIRKKVSSPNTLAEPNPQAVLMLENPEFLPARQQKSVAVRGYW